MDASATNYNPDAQVDDGTCEYIIQVSICGPKALPLSRTALAELGSVRAYQQPAPHFLP